MTRTRSVLDRHSAKRNVALSSGIRPLSHGIRTLSHRIRALSHGIRTLSHGIRALSQGIRPLSSGIRALSQGIRPLSFGIRALFPQTSSITLSLYQIEERVERGRRVHFACRRESGVGKTGPWSARYLPWLFRSGRRSALPRIQRRRGRCGGGTPAWGTADEYVCGFLYKLTACKQIQGMI